jgi:tetratricopeptide (TPR) repeat protein
MRYGVALAAALMLLALESKAQPSPQAQECTGLPGVAWDQQIKSCTALIQAGQGNVRDRAMAYDRRGNAYSAVGENDRAIADYNEAIRLDPNYAAPYYNWGEIYLDRNDADHAITEFDQSIRVDPKYARAYAGRALAYLKKGDFDRSLADADEAVRLDPKLGDAFASRANVYMLKGDYVRAAAEYNEALRLDPKSGYLHNNLGLVEMQKGDLDQAVAEFSEAIRLDPQGSLDSSGDYSNRGRAHFYAGALPKALADFKQANVVAPKSAYNALWLDIAEARGNMPSTLAEASAKVDMTVWPAPVIHMFLGQMPPTAVLAAANDPNDTKKVGRVCEANFFSGEWALRHNAKDEAARRFERAASGCSSSFAESSAAKLELKALNSKLR